MERISVVITTDGACSGNPGPGGWASILRCQGHKKIVTGRDPQTTNNRMELRAVIEATKVLKVPCMITIRTDSQYVINGIAAAPVRSQNGWKTKTGARCANVDLWQELAEVREKGNHRFQTLYVKGHTGDPDNEECDMLAKQQIGG